MPPICLNNQKRFCVENCRFSPVNSSEKRRRAQSLAPVSFYFARTLLKRPIHFTPDRRGPKSSPGATKAPQPSRASGVPHLGGRGRGRGRCPRPFFPGAAPRFVFASRPTPVPPHDRSPGLGSGAEARGVSFPSARRPAARLCPKPPQALPAFPPRGLPPEAAAPPGGARTAAATGDLRAGPGRAGRLRRLCGADGRRRRRCRGGGGRCAAPPP